MEAFCRLWDLSINPAVCELMRNLDIVAIVETFLADESAPARLQEV
jgi:hypothetical protein